MILLYLKMEWSIHAQYDKEDTICQQQIGWISTIKGAIYLYVAFLINIMNHPVTQVNKEFYIILKHLHLWRLQIVPFDNIYPKRIPKENDLVLYYQCKDKKQINKRNFCFKLLEAVLQRYKRGQNFCCLKLKGHVLFLYNKNGLFLWFALLNHLPVLLD